MRPQRVQKKTWCKSSSYMEHHYADFKAGSTCSINGGFFVFVVVDLFFVLFFCFYLCVFMGKSHIFYFCELNLKRFARRGRYFLS